MNNIKFYEVSESYVDYLLPHAPHLFHNKQKEQQNCFTYVDISKESNPKYKSLLLAEYRFIKSIQEKIRKNSYILYNLKTKGNISALTKRCNDFSLLEDLCRKYKNNTAAHL